MKFEGTHSRWRVRIAAVATIVAPIIAAVAFASTEISLRSARSKQDEVAEQLVVAGRKLQDQMAEIESNKKKIAQYSIDLLDTQAKVDSAKREFADMAVALSTPSNLDAVVAKLRELSEGISPSNAGLSPWSRSLIAAVAVKPPPESIVNALRLDFTGEAMHFLAEQLFANQHYRDAARLAQLAQTPTCSTRSRGMSKFLEGRALSFLARTNEAIAAFKDASILLGRSSEGFDSFKEVVRMSRSNFTSVDDYFQYICSDELTAGVPQRMNHCAFTILNEAERALTRKDRALAARYGCWADRLFDRDACMAHSACDVKKVNVRVRVVCPPSQ